MNKCINYDKCPSCSGWCNNKQPSGECIEFLLSAYSNLCGVNAELRILLDEKLNENAELEKYNSKLCIELTITMDKLYLAEKTIARLRGENNE